MSWKSFTKSSFFLVLESTAKSSPGTKFPMVKQILRPSLPWYTDNFDSVYNLFDVGTNTLGLNNVRKLDCVLIMAQQFNDRDMHLMSAAQKMFVQAILMTTEAFFKAENVDLLKDDEEMTAEEGGSGHTLGKKPDAKEKKDQVRESRINSLKIEVQKKRFMDNLMMARVCKELDSITNSKEEDRIVITGMTCKMPIYENLEQKRNCLENLFNKFVNGRGKG